MAGVAECIDPGAMFRECVADDSMPTTTGEGLSAVLQKRVDPGLYVGRHKRHGFYALLRRPWLAGGAWCVPVLDQRPVLVWELRQGFGERRAQELGDWVVRLALQHDLARQGYESPRDYALKQFDDQGRQLEEARRVDDGMKDELIDIALDRVHTRRRVTVRGWTPE